jgi:hypothetical protein
MNTIRKNTEGLYYLHYTLTPRPAIISWVEDHYKYFNDYDVLLAYKSNIMDNPLVNVLESGRAEFQNGMLVPITTK